MEQICTCQKIVVILQSHFDKTMSFLTHILAKLTALASSSDGVTPALYPHEEFEKDVMDDIVELKTQVNRLSQIIVMQQTQISAMQTFISQFIGQQYQNCSVHNGNNITNNNYYAAPPQNEQKQAQNEPLSSILFTNKARQEHKEEEIVLILQQSIHGRTDKARALVEQVRLLQKDGYIDPHYNARVMYDELCRFVTLPFEYPGFRKYYNE